MCDLASKLNKKYGAKKLIKQLQKLGENETKQGQEYMSKERNAMARLNEVQWH